MHKRIFLRIAAILLIAFALGFSITWRPDTQTRCCIGDEILENLGLKAWSNGSHGTHYTVLYGLGAMIIAFLMIALTTENRARNFLFILAGFSVVFILLNIVN